VGPVSSRSAEHLLLLMARFDREVTAAMLEVAKDPELVANAPLIVLCAVDLYGPTRPGALQEITGLSSGGMSKLLDRMEEARVVKRTYGKVPGDNRGVLVTVTARGKRLVEDVTSVLAARLPETKSFIKELTGALAH
jgi:DNA-binding MarR family transcriptional regulator